jgi:hypothetical protein
MNNHQLTQICSSSNYSKKREIIDSIVVYCVKEAEDGNYQCCAGGGNFETWRTVH